MENSLRKQIIIGDGSAMGFVTRPVALVILLMVVLIFIWPLIGNLLRKGRTSAEG